MCVERVCLCGVWSIRVFPVRWDFALGAVRCSHRVQLQCPFHTTVREAFFVVALIVVVVLVALRLRHCLLLVSVVPFEYSPYSRHLPQQLQLQLHQQWGYNYNSNNNNSRPLFTTTNTNTHTERTRAEAEATTKLLRLGSSSRPLLLLLLLVLLVAAFCSFHADLWS